VAWDHLPSLLHATPADLEMEREKEKEGASLSSNQLMSSSKDTNNATTASDSPRAVLRHVSSTALAKKLSGSPGNIIVGKDLSGVGSAGSSNSFLLSQSASSKMLSSPSAKLRAKEKKSEATFSGYEDIATDFPLFFHFFSIFAC
jgi:hypothetical protein